MSDITPGKYKVIDHGSSRALVVGQTVDVLEVTIAAVRFIREDGQKFAVSIGTASDCLRPLDYDETAEEVKPKKFVKKGFANSLMHNFAKKE